MPFFGIIKLIKCLKGNVVFYHVLIYKYVKSNKKKKKRKKEGTINEGKPIRRKKRERKKENTREKKDIV
jgi:hypothetical protein